MSGRLSALPSYILVVWRALPSCRLVVYGSTVARMDGQPWGRGVSRLLVTTAFSQGSLLEGWSTSGQDEGTVRQASVVGGISRGRG